MNKQPGLTLDRCCRAADRDPKALEEALFATYNMGRAFGELHSKERGSVPLSAEIINTLCVKLHSYYRTAQEKAADCHLPMPNTPYEIESAISYFKSEKQYGGFCHGDGHMGNILYDQAEGISFVDLEASSKYIDVEGNPTNHFIKCFSYNYALFLDDIEISELLESSKDRLITAFQEGHNSTFTCDKNRSSLEFSHLFMYYQRINDVNRTGTPDKTALQTNFKLLNKKASPGKLFPS